MKSTLSKNQSVKVPQISVCVITYNQEKYIRQCLQSIIDQKTNFDYEIIVGDDCSTDGTQDILKEFAEKYPCIFKLFLHDKNNGGVYNFKFVHDRAVGKYVAHIDGDDLMLPGKLQAQASKLESNPLCTAVWHRVDFFDDAGKFCSGDLADISPFVNGIVSFDNAIRLGFVGVHSSLMYRKCAQRFTAEDTDKLDLFRTWDVLSAGDGFILDQVLGKYRVGASGSLSVSSQLRIRRLSIDHARFFLKNFPEKRKNFFIFAISNAIIDTKNFRRTAFDFFIFSLNVFSFASPLTIIDNLKNIRKIQVPWNYKKID